MVGRMAKKKSKPLTPTQIPSDLEEFQSQYGQDWLNIKRHPAFIAGTQLLNIRVLKEITNLSDDEISKNGGLILARLIGQLKHEDDLFSLDSMTDFKMPVEDVDEYISPEEAEILRSKVDEFREQRKKNHYAT